MNGVNGVNGALGSGRPTPSALGLAAHTGLVGAAAPAGRTDPVSPPPGPTPHLWVPLPTGDPSVLQHMASPPPVYSVLALSLLPSSRELFQINEMDFFLKKWFLTKNLFHLPGFLGRFRHTGMRNTGYCAVL